MPLAEVYMTYPIHRDRDGTYSVEVGRTLEGAVITQGQFDYLEEAKEFVDELLETQREKLRSPAC